MGNVEKYVYTGTHASEKGELFLKFLLFIYLFVGTGDVINEGTENL